MAAAAGAFLHFLDSLACLFLGGAHLRHTVSTEGERERGRTRGVRRHLGRRSATGGVGGGACL